MKKILLGLALVAGVMTSCDDYLTKEPKLSQSNEITFSTFDNLNLAGAGLYTYMQSADWYDGEYILECELRGGNAKNPTSKPGSGRYTQDTQWNYTENYTSPIWSYCYYTIARANNVINNLEGKTSNEVSQQDVDNLHAEALFMRALCYLDLVTTYAQPYNNTTDTLGVPVVLVTENGKPARSGKTAVYNQIVSDLTEAESLMSDSYTRSDAADAAAVVSKPAIQALLSRVYLYMENWQQAANYATKVISSGKYSLATGNSYISMFSAATAPKNGEIIFEVYGSDKNSYWDDSGWSHLSWETNVDGYADICATADLHSLYQTGDTRLQFFKQNGNDWFYTKYSGKAGTSPGQTNVPILRLSEMYLNRAEAQIHGATVSGTSAQQDMQTVATARGTQAEAATATGIFTDRRKELAFEGHIVYDYARTNTSLTRTDFDGTVNKDVPYPSFRWAMPIPKRELDANANVVQNPGY